MSHMVIYRGSDGKPGYHQTDDIHDAVGFVEQMRNEQGVEHARIFRLEEVVFQYKPYYRVELADSIGSPDEESSTVEVPAVTTGDSSSSSNGNGDHGAKTGTVDDDAKSDDAAVSDSSADAESPSVAEPADSSIGDVVTGPGAKRSLFGR